MVWGAEVIAISLPLLWVSGRKLRAQETAHDEKVLRARGVGRLTVEALHGNNEATARLVKLLDDPEVAVRYQSARALVLMDKPELNKELFRRVSS
jgi:HEAT repeat protein